VHLYEFELPPGRIATHPLAERDASRLLVLDRASGERTHRNFRDLGEYLRAGDLLVVNETRVIRARLRARRSGGGRAEIFAVRPAGDERWWALVKPAARLRPGSEVTLLGAGEEPAGRARIEEAAESGLRAVRFLDEGAESAIERLGEVPLPPYIDRPVEAADRERYQTAYARVPGAVAAPTAGLHFAPEQLAALHGAGVRIASLVLHVGPGTFRPVTVEDPAAHRIDAEWCSIPAETMDAVRAAKARGSRVIAVGTTTTRSLEAAWQAEERSGAYGEWVDLFIHPPFSFQAVDALITNFHLPRSSLLLLVSAFAGRERVLAAYAEAIERGYRFYSYGDAMLIL
jgi:S-adenosylmethionine:tRNA ribosyltransferase-isomerase